MSAAAVNAGAAVLDALGAGWALRRVVRFLLRRALGRILSPESLDAHQLDVQLHAGTVELGGAGGELRLNAAYLNTLLPAASAFELRAGRVDRVRVSLPWRAPLTSGVEVALCGVALRLAPRRGGDAAAAAAQATPQAAAEEGGAAVRAAAAATAHLLSRLRVRVSGLELLLLEDVGLEAPQEAPPEARAQGPADADAPPAPQPTLAAALLRLRELDFRDDTPPAPDAAADASAAPPAPAAAVKAVSFEGAELFLGRGEPPPPGVIDDVAGWTRVLGHDADAREGWGGSARLTLPSSGAGAALEAALRPLVLHCAPAPLRDASAIVSALRTAQAAQAAAAAAAAAEAAAAAAEEEFQTPKGHSSAPRSFLGSLVYDTAEGDDAGGAAGSDAFFDCAETLRASLALSTATTTATTPRPHPADASSDSDEEDDHWTAAQWAALRASVSPNAPETPPAADGAAASAAYFAPPTMVWALELRLEGLRVMLACADDADAAALHLRSGAVALHCELTDGALRRCGARFENAAVLQSAAGDAVAAAAEQAALLAQLPPLHDAAESDPRLLRVLWLLPPPHDALDAPAVELDLCRDDAATEATALSWALTLALPPAALWWSDAIPGLFADALRSWAPGQAGTEAAEASPPAPLTVSLSAPQLRLALARRGKDGAAACLALDLRAARPQPGDDGDAPPLLRVARHADGGSALDAAFDVAELHIASATAPLQRLLRVSGGGVVRVHAPPRSALAAAPGVRLRAWGAAAVAAATADAAGADAAAGRPRSAADGVAAAEAALQAALQAGAALSADVALAALELASAPDAPFSRLYDLSSDAAQQQAAEASPDAAGGAHPAACSLALRLTASRLGIRLGASPAGGDGGALRARGVSVFHAAGLEGAAGTGLSLLAAESIRVDDESPDAPPLLRAAPPASAPAQCLRVTAASRPCAGHAGGELKLAAIARHAALAARRGDASCAPLRALLRRIAAELAPPAPLGPDGAPLPPPLMAMHVALADMSLLCGPPVAPPGRAAVAAALLAAAFCVRSDAAATALTLRGAAVHLARARSGEDEPPAPPELLRAHPIGDAELAAEEYVRVLRERQMTLTFRSEAAEAGPATTPPPISVTDLDNAELRIDTYRDTYDALWLLYAQLSGGGGGAPAAASAEAGESDTRPPAAPSVHPGVRAAVHRHLYAAAAAAAVRSARREAAADDYEYVGEAGPPAAVIEDFFVRLLPESSDADLADDDESELSGDGWVMAGAVTTPPAVQAAPRRGRDAAPRADANARYYPPGGPPRVRESHVPAPGGGEERSADEAPPGHYPRAISRFHARRLNLVWTLLPGAGFDGCGDRRCAVRGARLSLAGLTVRRDSFPPAAVHAWRLAASASGVELDDVTPGAPWARVLGPDTAPPAPPREAGAPAVRLLLRAVRPSPAAAPDMVEHRLHFAALPLRLRLDQNMLRFLAAFFSAADAAETEIETNPEEEEEEYPQGEEEYNEQQQEQDVEDACPAADGDGDAESVTFFQTADVRSLRLRVDYRPRAAPRGRDAASPGGAVGLLLAVPWGGVALRLPRVQLGGVAGWGALLSAVGGAWSADVAATQAHKFVRGVPVVRPIVAAGAGAAQLLAAPVATLRQERQRRALRGAARGALAFARTLGAEARAVQRTVAAGGRAALQAAADAASAAAAERAFR